MLLITDDGVMEADLHMMYRTCITQGTTGMLQSVDGLCSYLEQELGFDKFRNIHHLVKNAMDTKQPLEAVYGQLDADSVKRLPLIFQLITLQKFINT